MVQRAQGYSWRYLGKTSSLVVQTSDGAVAAKRLLVLSFLENSFPTVLPGLFFFMGPSRFIVNQKWSSSIFYAAVINTQPWNCHLWLFHTLASYCKCSQPPINLVQVAKGFSCHVWAVWRQARKADPKWRTQGGGINSKYTALLLGWSRTEKH